MHKVQVERSKHREGSVSYRLQDPKRGILGPVRLEMVRDLIATGAIDRAVLLSRDGGPFQPIDRFEELSQVVSKVAPRSFSGDLRQRTFFNVFYELYLRRSTGKLLARRGGKQREVYLEDGNPVFIASTIESERFGQFLVERGKLDPDDLQVALQSMHSDGGRLGTTLIRLGLLEPDEVFRSLRDQQVARLVDLYMWDTGAFSYTADELYLGDKFDLALDAGELLVRAAREMPELLLVERLDPYLNHFVQLTSPIEQVELGLSALERGVMEWLDGSHTPAEIIGKLFENEKRRRAALMVIYLLWEAGFVTFRPPAL